jgi:hypothetical protein
MKTLMCGITLSLGMFATNVMAEQILTVDGEDYPLSALMENCQRITDDPAAQISCFSAISRLMDEQVGASQEVEVSVTDELDALRAVAQYQDDDSGLLIAGSDCNVHVIYYNNYFHISRRNISSIDLFSAQFDAANLQFDQTVQTQVGPAPLSKGFMAPGANAAMRGGVELESAQYNFEPRSSRMALGDYANEVVAQLPATETQAFDFVLIHPQRSQASAEIWAAFENFVSVCDQVPPSWSPINLGNG